MGYNNSSFGFFHGGMEDAQLGQGQADQASQAGLDAANGAADMESESQALQTEQVKLEQATAELENLEGQQQVMQKQVNAGQGMDQAGAQATQLAVEAALIRIGAFDPSEAIVLGHESFGGGRDSFTATKISNEGLVDKLKDLWKRLKEGFKAFIQKVVDFFGKFFDNADKVMKYANALREKITARSSWKEKDKEIDYGGAVKCLVIDGKFDIADAQKIFKNHESMTKNFNNVVSHAGALVDGLNEIIKTKSTNIDQKLEDKIDAYANSYVAGIQGVGKVKKDGRLVITAGPFVYGESFVVTVDPAEWTLTVGMQQKAKPVKDTKFAAMPIAGMENCCDDIISLMKETNLFKKEQAKVKAVADGFVKLCDAALNFASSIADTGDNASKVESVISKVRRATTSIGNTVTRTVVMLPSWNVKLGNAALSCVNSSLNNLEEKGKK